MKKHHRIALSLCLILTLIFDCMPSAILAFAEDSETGFFASFDTEEEGKIPLGFDVYEAMGSIETKSVSDNMCLYLNPEAEGSETFLRRKFSNIETYKAMLTQKVMFPKAVVKAVPLSLYCDGEMVFSVISEDGAFYVKGSGDKTQIFTGIDSGEWYSISAEIDVLQSKVAISVNGSSAIDVTIATKGYINEYGAGGKVGPGFYLDDISLSNIYEISEVKVSGPEYQSISETKDMEYEYICKAYDTNMSEIEGISWSWSMIPQSVEGISMVTENNVCKVIVTPTATAETSYKIRCEKVGELAVFAEYGVTLKNAEVDALKIIGDGSINADNDKIWEYKVIATDDVGNSAESTDIIWSINPEAENDFKISKNGVLTLEKDSSSLENLIITAKYKENEAIVGTKKIAVLDKNTYLADKIRIQAVKDYIDTCLEYGHDIYHNTPCLANGISKDGEPVLWKFPNGDESALTDIGNQQSLFRTMWAYSEIYDKPEYKQRVLDIYEYTMNNHSQNYMIYLGPHSSCDLKTSKKANGMMINIAHEQENKNMFLEPFYQLDKDWFEANIKMHWASHIIDWSSLWFDRHGYFDSRDYNSMWNNTDIFIDNPEDPFVRNHAGQSFTVAAVDLIGNALTLYEKTGDPNALLWAKRLTYKYINLTTEEHPILPTSFTTGYLAPGTEKIPDWVYDLPEFPTEYTGTYYGDRVHNQFADQLLEEGYIEEEDYGLILEAYYNNEVPRAHQKSQAIFLKVAECLGLEDENDEGFPVLKAWTDSLSHYLDLAYDPTKLYFSCVITSVDLNIDGLRTKRGGYKASKGGVISGSYLTIDYLNPFVDLACRAAKFDSLKSKADTIMEVARDAGKIMGIGDIGNPIRGVAPQFDYSTTSTSAELLETLLMLYDLTGSMDYLSMARFIGNNIINFEYSNGLFMKPEEYTDWISSDEALVLMKLDAIINDEWSVSLDYDYLQNKYTQTEWVDEHGALIHPVDAYGDFYTKTYTDVFLSKISIAEKEIHLKAGETYNLTVKLYPNDAASKSYYWEIGEQSVARVNKNKVIAVAPGTTYIRAVSPNYKAVASEFVKVIVE